MISIYYSIFEYTKFLDGQILIASFLVIVDYDVIKNIVSLN